MSTKSTYEAKISVKKRESSMALLLGLSKEAVLGPCAPPCMVFLLDSFLCLRESVSSSTGECGCGSSGVTCIWSSAGIVQVNKYKDMLLVQNIITNYCKYSYIIQFKTIYGTLRRYWCIHIL